MATTSNVSISRDNIRNDIITNIKEYLELENIDLTKSSFLTFLVDTLSTLTSNLLFYEVSVFREFFMTTAQTKESIYNLSSFLGYSVNYSQYATCNVLVKIPLTFTDSDVTITIPSDHIFYASDIQFRTYYVTTLNIVDYTNVTVTITQDNYVYNVTPQTIDNEVQFLLPTRQIEKIEGDTSVDADIGPYQFVTKILNYQVGL